MEQMASTLSTLAPAEKHEQEATKPEQPAPRSGVAPSSARVEKRIAALLFLFGVVFFGSIGTWLWYGIHGYQNCSRPF
jgi:hypothetical protein